MTAVHLPLGFREEGKGLRVLTQQILLEQWDIKSSILAHYISVFLVLRWARIRSHELLFKIQKSEIIGYLIIIGHEKQAVINY